jgi:hypothetical protein
LALVFWLNVTVLRGECKKGILRVLVRSVRKRKGTKRVGLFKCQRDLFFRVWEPEKETQAGSKKKKKENICSTQQVIVLYAAECACQLTSEVQHHKHQPQPTHTA